MFLKYVKIEEEYIHPSKLKDGDIIKIWNEHEPRFAFIYIFKEYKDNQICRHVGLSLFNNELNTNPTIKWGSYTKCDKITYATEAEKKLLLEALAREGYYWDFDINTLVKSMSVDIAQPITNPYEVFVDLANPNLKQENSDELNLFPTKKHYQLNFNY